MIGQSGRFKAPNWLIALLIVAVMVVEINLNLGNKCLAKHMCKYERFYLQYFY